MSETDYYILQLDGSKRWLDYTELHKIRKDILLYFDDNLGEIDSVLMPLGEFELPYWEFISINFDKEWAESQHYKKLIEEGCLALLNGISLEILYEPVSRIHKNWQQTPAQEILSYIQVYQANNERLNTAKNHLIQTYKFIETLTDKDIDQDGLFKEFDTRIAGKWFSENIVQAYYKWLLNEYT